MEGKRSSVRQALSQGGGTGPARAPGSLRAPTPGSCDTQLRRLRCTSFNLRQQLSSLAANSDPPYSGPMRGNSPASSPPFLLSRCAFYCLYPLPICSFSLPCDRGTAPGQEGVQGEGTKARGGRGLRQQEAKGIVMVDEPAAEEPPAGGEGRGGEGTATRG